MTWPDLQESPAAPRPVRQLADALTNQIRDACEEAPTEVEVVRLEVEAGDVSPLHWLAHQPEFAMTYWRDRNGQKEIAGLGATWVVEASAPLNYTELMDQLHAVLDRSTSDIYFHGGLAFDTVGSQHQTADLPAARFVLPRFEFLRRPGHPPVLACNLLAHPGRSLREDAAAALEELAVVVWLAVDDEDTLLPACLSRHDEPEEDYWMTMVRGALDAIDAKRFEKVVLARRSTLHFAAELHAPTLLQRLAASTPGCFHFYTQPGGGLAFIGASPELLYERHGRDFETEALAGTRPRGADPSEDARLAADLQENDKERREHAYVMEAIHRAMVPLCTDFASLDLVHVLKLARVQHLHQRAGGTLRPEVRDADILAALHPTPAVGGLPTAAALAHLHGVEPFDRAWYAGPVGWVGRDTAAFAVGIRSGLVAGRDLSLYSGAGIVAGSDPAAEWREIEAKLSSFLHAIRD